MATIHLTEASSGAPTLSGTNGALCTVLDWALLQNGWAIEYTAANHRVYRAGVGNRHRLFVAHDSTVSGAATLATIRGCESATAASTVGIVDAFPTTTQTTNANSTVSVSQAAGATARAYDIKVGTNFVVMAISTGSSNALSWDIFAFGDFGTDAWATGIWIGNTNVIGSASRAMNATLNQTPAASGRIYWCRNVDGSIKSAAGSLVASGAAASALGSMGTMPAMRAGYANRIVREKIAVSDTGSTGGTIGPLVQHKRGWLPFVWAPMHAGIGAVTSDDTFQDTAYSASAVFKIIPASSGVACILETTDTWVTPSG